MEVIQYENVKVTRSSLNYLCYVLFGLVHEDLSRNNWTGVKSEPPGPFFACQKWDACAKIVPDKTKRM